MTTEKVGTPVPAALPAGMKALRIFLRGQSGDFVPKCQCGTQPVVNTRGLIVFCPDCATPWEQVS